MMPYSTGMIIIGLCMVVIFGTFLHILINARTVARIFRGSHSDMVLGPGSDRKTASKGAVIVSIIAHFAAWGVVGFVWLNLLAEGRATASDTTPLEEAGVVSDNGSSPR